jgi:hypothetical protein
MSVRIQFDGLRSKRSVTPDARGHAVLDNKSQEMDPRKRHKK